MKTKKMFLVSVVSAFLVALLAMPSSHYSNKEIEKDNIEYDDPIVVAYDKPDYVSNVTRASKWPNKVEMHYHSDAGDCDNKAFYFWFTGVNGKQYAPDVVSSDKQDMSITVDFSKEEFAKGYQNKMFMIIKGSTLDDWSEKTDDTPIDYEDFTIDDNGTVSIWAIPGEGSSLELYDTEEDSKMDKILTASFKSDWKTISVLTTIAPTSYKIYALTGNYYSLDDNSKSLYKERYLIKTGENPVCQDTTFNDRNAKIFEVALNFTIRINVQYQITAYFPTKPEKEQTKFVASDALYETPRFERYYNYDGKDLGVTYSANETTFKVWAPTATRMILKLYDSLTPSSYENGDDYNRGFIMSYQPGGIWQVTITNQNLANKGYKFTVYNSLGKAEVVDPYAHACGINGERGAVVNFSSTNPSNWNEVDTALGTLNSPNELTIYESHIRDLTMHETWTGQAKRGTFLAYIEDGTSYQESGYEPVTTGFAHLKEMGMNAIQLTPVFDHDDNETEEGMHYNWGYNPLNYNCVEGGYSSNPYSATARIREFKQLVAALAFSGNQTRTIMDVVYNHVSSAPASNFNKLMPKYYFRLTQDGHYYNGSGCGNEVKTEAPMMRKFIVESLCWWASEYKIKGFRFDLMGLIDWKTLDLARSELYKIDPSIYLYGEGWTGDGSDSGHVNEEYYGTWGSNTWTVYNKLPSEANKCIIGAFNDRGRNALKGENDYHGNNFWGFINQDSNYVGNKTYAIADMLAGYHDSGDRNFKDPNQSISYASCHDNFTLFDQMRLTVGVLSNDHPGSTMAAVSAIECTILMSNGVAFIQGGEELFRSKLITNPDDLEIAKSSDYIEFNGMKISHNSYNLSDDCNAYDWQRKMHVEEKNSTGYVKAIKQAIKARKSMTKYTKSDLSNHSPFDSGSPFNIWNRGDHSTSLGMKNGDYFFFVAGCNNDAIPFDAINSMNYNEPTFCSNIYYNDGDENPKYGFSYHLSTGHYDGSVTLGWYTCVLFKQQ